MSVSRVGTTDPRAATQSEQINRNEAKGVEKNDAARQVKAAAIAAPKDVLVAGVGGDAEPVAALTTEAVKPMSNAEALALLSALKPLMGKPNGLPFPDEAFAHPALLEGASTQAPLGAETKTILCNALASAATDKAAGDPDALASLFGMQLKTLAFPSRAERQKWLEAQEKKCGALATAIVGDGASPLPADVRRRLGPRFAEVSRALEDTFRAQRNAANGPRRMQSDVEIPGPEVVALEKAVAGVLPEITAALRQGSDAAAVVGKLGIDWSIVDIDSMIAIVMMECGRAATDELREALTTMQENNKKKKAQREQLTKMKAEKAEVDAAMHQEYDALRADGKIDPSYSFEDFAAWRAVEWDADGNAQLKQPRDPLPDVATHPPADASAVDGSGSTSGDTPVGPLDGVPPCPDAVVQAMAEKYGIREIDIQMLWVAYHKDDRLKANHADFEAFLTGSPYDSSGNFALPGGGVGLVAGGDNTSQIEAFRLRLEAQGTAATAAAGSVDQEKILAAEKIVAELKLLEMIGGGQGFEYLIEDLRQKLTDLGLNPAERAELDTWVNESMPALVEGFGVYAQQLQQALQDFQANAAAWNATTDGSRPGWINDVALGWDKDGPFISFTYVDHGGNPHPSRVTPFPPQNEWRPHGVLVCYVPPLNSLSEDLQHLIGDISALMSFDALHGGLGSAANPPTSLSFTGVRDACDALAHDIEHSDDPSSLVGLPPAEPSPEAWQLLLLEAWPQDKHYAPIFARGRAPIPKAPDASETSEETSDTADLGPPPDTLEGARQTGNLAGFEAEIQRMDDKIQATSDLSEELSLKLQMLMDRRQKAMELLSNLLKKMSDTSGAIIANTRG